MNHSGGVHPITLCNARRPNFRNTLHRCYKKRHMGRKSNASPNIHSVRCDDLRYSKYNMPYSTSSNRPVLLGLWCMGYN